MSDDEPVKKARARKPRKPPVPDELALPGMDEVAPSGPPAYRVEAGSVPARHIDAVITGRADMPVLTRKQFDALMRILCALRIEAFDLPFDTFSGGTCATVRKGLKTYKASEIARAIRGAGKDEWAQRRKPSLAAIIARVPEWLTLADDATPQERPRTTVIAEYLRLYQAAYDLDFWKGWPEPNDVETHNTAMIEKWVDEMRETIKTGKLSDDDKRRLLGVRRR